MLHVAFDQCLLYHANNLYQPSTSHLKPLHDIVQGIALSTTDNQAGCRNLKATGDDEYLGIWDLHLRSFTCPVIQSTSPADNLRMMGAQYLRTQTHYLLQ